MLIGKFVSASVM